MEKFKFKCKNGTVVDIEVDDFSYEVEVYGPNRMKLGGMRFHHVQDYNDDALKLTWAYLDEAGPSYLRQGIGRECLRRMHEVSCMPLFSENHDGIIRDDGSHLTGDAPAFVDKMRDEKLIG